MASPFAILEWVLVNWFCMIPSYHLFENEELITSMEVNYTPFSLEGFLCFSGFGNICVSMFVFLTAFGIARGLEGQWSPEGLCWKSAYGQAARRFLRLMLNFAILYADLLRQPCQQRDEEDQEIGDLHIPPGVVQGRVRLKLHPVLKWLAAAAGFVLCVLIRQNYMVHEYYIHLIRAAQTPKTATKKYLARSGWRVTAEGRRKASGRIGQPTFSASPARGAGGRRWGGPRACAGKGAGLCGEALHEHLSGAHLLLQNPLEALYLQVPVRGDHLPAIAGGMPQKGIANIRKCWSGNDGSCLRRP